MTVSCSKGLNSTILNQIVKKNSTCVYLHTFAFCLPKQHVSSLKTTLFFTFCRLADNFKRARRLITLVSEFIKCWHIITLWSRQEAR